jgi:FkbM family methyltransferase
MTVVDIGANIGIYTRFFSQLVGPLGQVHAFEPDPINFKRLRRNTSHLQNVFLHQTAVGDRNGNIKLYVSDEMNVDHRTFDSGDGRLSIDVPVLNLDDYFLPSQSVDVIKIDVQGYELSVLQGAKRVLSENYNLKILMEFWPYGLLKACVTSLDLLEFFKALSFEVRKVSDPTGPIFDGRKFNSVSFNCHTNLIITRIPKTAR